jgi:hypothetical protein
MNVEGGSGSLRASDADSEKLITTMMGATTPALSTGRVAPGIAVNVDPRTK